MNENQVDKLMQLTGAKSVSELADIVGEKPNTISMWKSRGIPEGKILSISQIVGCEPYELSRKEYVGPETGRVIGYRKGNKVERKAIIESQLSSDHGEKTARMMDRLMNPNKFEGCVLIPRYDVTASAGAGAAVAYENEVDRMAFNEQWLKVEMGVQPNNMVLITTSGDSMEPTLRPGDLLLLDTSVTELRENAIYAVQVGGSLLVKRIQKRMDGSVLIKSDNPAYETEEIRGELTEGVKIVGKLIWAGKRF